MNLLLQIFFWLSVFALFHSYLLYPVLLRWFTRGKKNNQIVFGEDEKEALPNLYILMAAYNEEKVIEEKLQSIFETDYPIEKLQIWIGSDNSTDSTNKILAQYAQKYDCFHWHNFEGRNGKIRIINQLHDFIAPKLQTEDILILTDANVFFTPSTLFQLAKHYKNPKVGVVAANILNLDVKEAGISFQEKWYIQRENSVKYLEGIWGGCMMGAFGAAYALKASLFERVPENFIVDDFYLTLKAIEKKGLSIKEPQAVCYEDVSDDIFEEFRRKKRISAGNFQNLHAFAHLTHPRKGKVAFCFWSHKVLRWLGSFFMLIAFFCSLILAAQNHFYALLLYLEVAICAIPLLDYLLKKINIHSKILRFITYFQLMNIALFLGFFNYLNGIKSNVWRPTKRN
ncbi:MAG: glycosyltransferase [Chitinophagales bacterium]